MRSPLVTAAVVGLGLALAGCGGFDPLDKLQDLDILGTSKTPLQGPRRPVFDSGVPGVPQGVPPELVKGYQAPVEAPPPVIEAKPERKAPRPKKTAAAPRRAAPPPRPQAQQRQQQQPQEQQPPAAQGRTTTQQVNQSSGQMQQMPGAQPTWPTNAPPAGPWAGPQR